MSFFSKARKYAKKATKAVGKRYGTSVGRRGIRISRKGANRMYSEGQKVAKLAAQVGSIMERLNVEKKSKTGLVQLGNVAQMNQNTFGFVTHDLTPLWTQGVGEDQRVGNSLKLTGYNMKIQLRGQQNTVSARRMKLMIIKTTDTTTPLINIVNDILDPNPLTGIIDYHSQWDYSDNKRVHKVLRTVRMYIKPPEFSTGSQSEKSIRDYNISLRLNDVLRFENNLVQEPNDCRYFLVILCDTGNLSATGSTNPGSMVPTGLSGVEYQFHDKFWYVDN